MASKEESLDVVRDVARRCAGDDLTLDKWLARLDPKKLPESDEVGHFVTHATGFHAGVSFASKSDRLAHRANARVAAVMLIGFVVGKKREAMADTIVMIHAALGAADEAP